ncbi:pickpocket protein 11-like [Nilaparvata lugens]|uniref:pickpocket protein 11-like n=1 Tax=Nilaparvata lugens TaxID=108931 RepID=UPI00193D45B3|nr:pickpocket protein 11-like [Nilaparvata lugens]
MPSDVWFLWQKRFKQFEVVLGLSVLVLIFVDRIRLNTIQSHLDVDYLHWTSKFPAVSICPKDYQGSRNLTSCEEVFRKCSWNNQFIDCCSSFEPVVSTSKDLCYTFNSDFTGARKLSKYVVSHFAKSGVLETETKYPVQVFVHDGKSVNFTEPGLVVTKRRAAEILVKINSIIVDESLYDLPFEKRGCILPGERFTSGLPIYSESLCRARCADSS